MENNNSIIGIKINKTNIPAKCIMIIKKYQDLSISEIKQKYTEAALAAEKARKKELHGSPSKI